MIASPPQPTIETPLDFEARLLERERDLLGYLDWNVRPIGMVCDSRLERDMRLGACRKEPETVEWLERVVKPDDVVYDVGACSGAYSLIAAALRGLVFAFEPSATNYRQLTRNACLNRLPITSLPVALGSETKLTGIDLSSPQSGAASHRLTDDDLNNGHAVLVWNLDRLRVQFALPQPVVMKVDVDGYEQSVLEGAQVTLLGVRSLMVEVRDDTSARISKMLASVGLREVNRSRRIEPTQFNVEFAR